MKIYTRVLTKAQLPNISGSIKAREAHAQALRRDGFNWAAKVFGKKGRITLREVKEFFAQKFLNISIKVDVNKAKTCSGFLQSFFTRKQKSLKGFLAGLKASGGGQEALTSVNEVGVFLHEHSHFCDSVTNPKLGAKGSNFERLFSSKMKKSVSNFYDDCLYFCHYSGTSEIYPPREREKSIKSHIVSFFKRQEFSSEQKIAILQEFRGDLKSEQIAYTEERIKVAMLSAKRRLKELKNDSAAYPYVKIDGDRVDFHKLDASKRDKLFLKSEDKEVKENLEHFLYKRFYPQKIKIIEELLAAEIQDHRQKHAAKLHDSL